MRTGYELSRMRTSILVLILFAFGFHAPAFAQDQLPGSPPVHVRTVKPAVTKAPVVIMLHGGGGLDGDQTAAFEKWSAWFASQGVGSIIVDSYRGRGIQAFHAGGNVSRAAFMNMINERSNDLRRTIDWARGQAWVDPQRIATFGQSQGAIVATIAALEQAIAVPQIAFYNGCDPRYFDAKPVPSSYPPSLWLLAGDDKVTPAASCEATRSRMGVAGQSIRIIVYPGAAHTFDWEAAERVWQGHTLRYNKAAHDGARSAIAEFLRAQRFIR